MDVAALKVKISQALPGIRNGLQVYVSVQQNFLQRVLEQVGRQRVDVAVFKVEICQALSGTRNGL